MSNNQRNVFITGGTGSVGEALVSAFCKNYKLSYNKKQLTAATD